MPVSRATGPKGLADILHSRIVRSRGACERCGGGYLLQTAHIVRRGYSMTRCVEDNSWCLCDGCHRETEDDPAEFMALVDGTIGRDRYDELRRLANAGQRGNANQFWLMEVAKLRERCRELGLSEKRAA